MKLANSCWSLLVSLFDAVTFQALKETSQKPIGAISVPDPIHYEGPVFSPPNGPDDFFCDYSGMKSSGWKGCSTPEDRTCWLRNGKLEYNITTDYEKIAPQGMTRKYTLDVGHMTLYADGYKNVYGKVFNQSFPGPWIKACWGDDLEITVTNHLRFNGTSIHWHGIRQYNTLSMDGVNGVTQCPIAGQPTPDTFTYKFKALQYGSSWYHSHYSLQYPDGVLGPLTIFGPSSANYDEAIDPILISDYNHQSAFELFYQEVTPGQGPPSMTSILLNGIGHYDCTDAEKKSGVCIDQNSKFNVTFTRGKKYLLRLINTSTDTTFIFAIDNHNVTVVGADFVPIHPYSTDSVLVGIGQRYHIIVEAKPINDKRPGSQQNFWIRTVPADGCYRFSTNPYPDERTGIVFYNDSNRSIVPNTSRAEFPTACSDEPYESLVPVVPWTIGRPANEQEKSTFQVGLTPPPALPPGPPPPGNFSRWEMGSQPLWLNFSNPTILSVNQKPFGKQDWGSAQVVVPQAVASDSWVYLVITATGFPFGGNPSRNFVPASHPIHMHGHDFAILQQSKQPFWDSLWNLTVHNPPRRDVALLPAGGYLVLAFKADNPGSWLLHCHIAWHASSGLAAQILERDGSIQLSSHDIAETTRVCDNWDSWYANTNNWWNSSKNADFQEDSGI